MAPIPITIITGFLGSGKTTLILNLIPQLPSTYRLALLKNEFGDLAVDSQLASQKAISGVKELLNGCICCNLIGQLSDALLQLRTEVEPDRIIIETSGSAFPATLAMEVNRLAHSHPGMFILDGVISVIDVENWQGYEDTSYTAKLQARYTDLIVFNKWEVVPEQRFEECLDRVGDLELNTAWVKSRKGWVHHDLVVGIDGALIAKEGISAASSSSGLDSSGHGHGHGHDHQSEVEVLSISIASESRTSTIDIDALEELLLAAPKDEVYRIKGFLRASRPPADSSGNDAAAPDVPGSGGESYYALNWAFGRWNYTRLDSDPSDDERFKTATLRLTMILARGESKKWQKRVQEGDLVQLEGEAQGSLSVGKIA